MRRHYRITIDVTYDENTVPETGMEDDLRHGIDAAVGEGLLNGADEVVIIEEYTVKVEETTRLERFHCHKHGDVKANPNKNGDVLCPRCVEEYIEGARSYPRIAEAAGKALRPEVSMGCAVAGAVPDSFEEVDDGLTGADSILAEEDQRIMDSLTGTARALSLGFDVGKAQSQALEEELKHQEALILQGLNVQREWLTEHPLHSFEKAQKAQNAEAKACIIEQLNRALSREGRSLFILPSQDRWDKHFPGTERTAGRLVSVNLDGVYIEYPAMNTCFIRYENIERLVLESPSAQEEKL